MTIAEKIASDFGAARDHLEVVARRYVRACDRDDEQAADHFAEDVLTAATRFQQAHDMALDLATA